MEELLELPASELMGWQEYFDIYPFTQDREDARAALIAQTITNMSGKAVKKQMDIDLFIPKWLNDSVSTPRTLEQQVEADKAFGEKLMQMQAIARTN